MPPPTALRLLSQPSRGLLAEPIVSCRAKLRPRVTSQLTFHTAGTGRPLVTRPSICLRCSLQATARLYTTGPKDSSKPPAESGSSENDNTIHLGPPPENVFEPPKQETTAPFEEPPAATEQTSNVLSNSSAESSSSPPESPSATELPEPESKPTPQPASKPEPELPSDSESRRHPLSARFSTFMDNLQSRAFVASQTLNDLTGYSAIEAIKAENTRLEQALADAQAHLKHARRAYQQLTTERAATQREVTTLLARKDSWTPADLERFTSLYRHDHSADRAVAEAAAALTEAEAEEARLSAALTNGILRRYHEEQVWSDRIRRQSTWGTWGLMGVNVLLFIAFQFVAEPWKRARLVRGVAEREREVLDEVKRELAEVRAALEASERKAGEREAARQAEKAAVAVAPVLAPALAEVSSSPAVPEEVDPVVVGTGAWEELFADPNPGNLKAAVLDLSSDRKIALRMRDASLLALEGAAAGLVVAFGVFFTFFRGT